MSINSQSLRQRRRRVAREQNQSAIEPRVTEAAASSRNGVARQPAASPYTEGARRNRQSKTTDLIPKRGRALSALAVALLLAIAALNGIQYSIPVLEVSAIPGVASVLSLESSNGINAWYCNLLLLLTAVACIQVYVLRQHRRDDYRGTYRVWLWFSASLVLASMATVSSISELPGRGLEKLFGPEGSSSFWSTVVLSTFLSVLVIRGFVEVRRSRLAVTALAVVFIGYAGTMLLQQFPALAASVSAVIPSTQGNLILLAASSLLFGTLGFARYVYLEAHGLIKLAADSESRADKKAARAAKKKKAEKPRKESARKSKRQAVAGNSRSDSNDEKTENTVDAKSGAQKAERLSAMSLLSNRSERNSGRSDNRVGSGQTLDRQARSTDSGTDEFEGLSKSEQRRLRKQKRRAA